MRVIVIGPNIGMGGVERESCNVSNLLESAGLEVMYLALIPEKPFFKLNESVLYVEPEGYNENKLDMVKSIKFIRKNVKKFNPDFIIAFTKFYGTLANMSLLFTRYKLYIRESSSPLYRWARHINLFNKLSISLRKPYGIAPQTVIGGEYQQKFYKIKNSVVIPNPVRKIKLFPEIKREKIILCVGRHGDRLKGFDLIIQAFDKLNNDDWELHFAGILPEEGDDLLEYLTNKSKSKRIKFLGKLGGNQLDETFAKAGIFAMPSRSEGFPNALAEALSAGVPCVSFDFISGAKDLIDDGRNGLLAIPEDVEDFTNKLGVLIEDEEKRKAFEIAAKASTANLTQEKITEKYLKLFN